MDLWEVLRALRARPLVAATARDEDINGADAVDELVAIREQLDAALARETTGPQAPRNPIAARSSRPGEVTG